MRVRIVVVLLFYLFHCSQSVSAQSSGCKPSELGDRLVENLLMRKGFMMYDTEDVKAVHYAEVCAAFGAVRLLMLTGDSVSIERISDRYMIVRDSIINTANHVDANVYGILPLALFSWSGDTVFYHQGMDLVTGQWENPLPDGLTNQTRYWIDDVYMINSLQVQAYRVTQDLKYLDRAALETAAYLEKLQQSNGLFHHGPEAPFFWGRGNGWVAAGLAELLSELPKDHQYYKFIESGYLKMMNSLLDYQADDGMWRQLLDKDYSWKESSCTAMFAYAISVGVDRGILDSQLFYPTVIKAWTSLCGRIDEAGNVAGVCAGTGQSTDEDYYLNRPRINGDFHGQAPVLWLAGSLLGIE